MLWALLSFLIVASTKYLTSLRLRNLRQKVQRDQQDAEDLRRVLNQTAEKENMLRAQTEELVVKINALNNIVSNLERPSIRQGNSSNK